MTNNSISDTAISRYTTESFDLHDSYVNEKDWNGDGIIFALGTNGLLYNSLDTLKEKIGTERPFHILLAGIKKVKVIRNILLKMRHI